MVASIETYLGCADMLAEMKPASAPPFQPPIVPAAPIVGVNGHHSLMLGRTGQDALLEILAIARRLEEHAEEVHRLVTHFADYLN